MYQTVLYSAGFDDSTGGHALGWELVALMGAAQHYSVAEGKPPEEEGACIVVGLSDIQYSSNSREVT